MRSKNGLSVYPIGSLVIAAILSSGCYTGYMAVVAVNGVPSIERGIVVRLEQEVTSKGFDVKTARNSHYDARGEPEISSRYLKGDSNDDRSVEVGIVYSSSTHSSAALHIKVSNKTAGKDPAIRAQVDDVAEACYRILVATYGQTKVEIGKWETGPALFH